MHIRMITLLVCAAVLAGCQHIPDEKNTDVFKPAGQYGVSANEYRVNPPDVLTVLAPNIRELDGQKREIGPDGKVTFSLLGTVFVAGKTAEEIDAALRKLAMGYYADPEIKVLVEGHSKFYFIWGFGAIRQGKYPYNGRNTVISALAEAGFNEKAWPEKVFINRPAKQATVIVDFMKMIERGDMGQDYLIEEGDMINVPRTRLAEVGDLFGRIPKPPVPIP